MDKLQVRGLCFMLSGMYAVSQCFSGKAVCCITLPALACKEYNKLHYCLPCPGFEPMMRAFILEMAERNIKKHKETLINFAHLGSTVSHSRLYLLISIAYCYLLIVLNQADPPT